MKADTVNLTRIFGKDARYVVPLFQRPYVWNQEDNWAPLWDDIRQTIERHEASADEQVDARPHFLGAIVLDQVISGGGQVETRPVIDGQQRLTTLQVFLASARQVALDLGCDKAARLLTKLLDNDPDLVDGRDHIGLLKVWPTNADQADFQAVMHNGMGAGALAKAWAYFTESLSGWAQEAADPERRMDTLVFTVREQLRLVVIDLEDHDDAQMIFETLNDRGTQLEAADLVKNLLFRRAEAAGADVQNLYDTFWAQFDGPYWRSKRTTGRIVRSRLDVFLSHWITMQTRKEVTVQNLFAEFERWTRASRSTPSEAFAELARYGLVYQSFDNIPRYTPEGRFFYRLEVLQNTTVMPLLLFLYGLAPSVLSDEQRLRAIRGLDSYIVRRDILKLPTKDYNNIFRLVLAAAAADPDHADDAVIDSLQAGSGINQWWPDDEEFVRALKENPLYQTLYRGRLRILLEGIEDQLRTDMTEQLVTPAGEFIESKLTIEHVLPQSWRTNWPIADPSPEAADSRDYLLHTLGNLTLATKALNPTLGNDGWQVKRKALAEHSLLRLTTGSILTAPPSESSSIWADDWDEDRITARGAYLSSIAVQAWPYGG